MQNRQRWQLELANATRTIEQLQALLPIQNKKLIQDVISHMRLSITPHQRSLIDFSHPHDPLLLMCVPREQELFISQEEVTDPINETKDSPVPFLFHRYQNRALICCTFHCAGYCRFCFRKYKTGQATPGPTREERKRIFDYLRAHTEINEAILSGGDPFTLTDNLISEWISELKSISSITNVRIHTRSLVNLPSRITPDLIEILKAYTDPEHSLTIVTHFNHPREIAAENKAAIANLLEAGIILKNQNVLLCGVNDSVETLKELFAKLKDLGVELYYMHQLDLARGTNHFRVPIENGMKLVKQLHEKLPNTTLPRYMLDLPGGYGKIEILPENIWKQGTIWMAKTPSGEIIEYNEPKSS